MFMNYDWQVEGIQFDQRWFNHGWTKLWYASISLYIVSLLTEATKIAYKLTFRQWDRGLNSSIFCEFSEEIFTR